jgi:Tol biopolymer transport system component
MAAGIVPTLWRGGRKATPPTQAEWTQLTAFHDSAVAPAVSADGKVLVFLRGLNTFFGTAELYVKLLPDGEPAQLTHDGTAKMAPAVAPDGSRIAYTVVDDTFGWETYSIPLLGGESRRMLANAAALTWTGPNTVMFSKIMAGSHMSIATAEENRTGERDVYVPAHDWGMGHRSYLSPDRKNVLIVEMDNDGWLPCREAPFDGSSAGRRVGPAEGRCTYAAWSPDGQWMYLNSDAGRKGFHIWRQRARGGEPEQITFGPTEQEGIAMMPDGKSLISSVGQMETAVWVRDAEGDRQMTTEESSSWPQYSSDGKYLYYLAGAMGPFANGELRRVDLKDGSRETVLRGIQATGYALSREGGQVAFTTSDAHGRSRLWLAPLDRRTAPRQVDEADILAPSFARDGSLGFMVREGGKTNYLYRARADGSGQAKVTADPVLDFMGFSPDGQWMVVWRAAATSNPAVTSEIVAYPAAPGAPLRVCDACNVTWSGDGKFIYIATLHKMFRLPVSEGKQWPRLPADGLATDAAIEAVPGARVVYSSRETLSDPGLVTAAPDGSRFAYVKSEAHRNLYRIPVP